MFWTDSWLPDGPIASSAPNLFRAIRPRLRGRCVKEALHQTTVGQGHLEGIDGARAHWLELGLRRGIRGQVMTQLFWYDSKHGRHKIFWNVPIRYDTNTRVVPCPESRYCGLHGSTRILGCGWAGMARKHIYNNTIQFSSIYYTTSYLILE
jgi:hypothetical protein